MRVIDHDAPREPCEPRGIPSSARHGLQLTFPTPDPTDRADDPCPCPPLAEGIYLSNLAALPPGARLTYNPQNDRYTGSSDDGSVHVTVSATRYAAVLAALQDTPGPLGELLRRRADTVDDWLARRADQCVVVPAAPPSAAAPPPPASTPTQAPATPPPEPDGAADPALDEGKEVRLPDPDTHH